MPSEKPKIVVYTNRETIAKIDAISKNENRSRGNLCETLIKDYIERYENEHGEIPIDEE